MSSSWRGKYLLTSADLGTSHQLVADIVDEKSVEGCEAAVLWLFLFMIGNRTVYLLYSAFSFH
jgi:hypothetical protein